MAKLRGVGACMSVERIKNMDAIREEEEEEEEEEEGFLARLLYVSYQQGERQPLRC